MVLYQASLVDFLYSILFNYVSLYNSFLLILGFFYVITYGLVSVLSDSCQGKLLIKNNTPKMMGAHSFLTQKIAESHFRVFVLY